MFGIRVHRDLVYGTGSIGNPATGEIELRLDLYEPLGQPEVRPGLVHIHGGGFTIGDKADLPDSTLAQEFASRGYVVASINYRMKKDDPTFKAGPWDDAGLLARTVNAAIRDADTAVRWMRRHASEYNVDPSRIAISGSSAGATTALFQSYQEMGGESEVRAVVEFLGGLYGLESEIDDDDPPLFIVHGTEDEIVPLSLAKNLATRSRAVGLPVEFLPLEGEDHGWQVLGVEVGGVTVMQRSVDFLFEHLALSKLSPGPMYRELQLISRGDQWAYFRGVMEPAPFPELAWTTREFDESHWSTGRGGFGYGADIEERNVRSVLDDMESRYSTLYVRHRFDIDDPSSLSALILELDYDDAFVAYVNGVEVARSIVGTPGTPVPFDAILERRSQHCGAPMARPAYFPRDFKFIDLAAFPDLLRRGDNVMSIQGIGLGDSDRDFVLSQISLSAFVPIQEADDADRDRSFE